MTIVTRSSIAATLLVLGVSAPAFADANTVARAHSEAFARACASGKLDAVLALYEDDAIVVWPGQGEEAKGKAAIEKLAAALCNAKDPAPVLKSVEGRQLGKDYVATHGRWEQSSKAPDGTTAVVVIRTTEVLKETGGKWRYVVDHASIGVPPPPAPNAPSPPKS
jgi:uncharacterized protein (TIGR02246 family)